MNKLALATSIAALAAAPALAQDAYVIGVSAAMTGPAAGTYAPVIEAMKAYLDHVNGRGGINGKPVRVVVQDNQAEPSKAAADASTKWLPFGSPARDTSVSPVVPGDSQAISSRVCSVPQTRIWPSTNSAEARTSSGSS